MSTRTARYGLLVGCSSRNRDDPYSFIYQCLLGFPRGLEAVKRYSDLTLKAASGAFRFTTNTGQSKFYGEKYKVDRVSYFVFFSSRNATISLIFGYRRCLKMTGPSLWVRRLLSTFLRRIYCSSMVRDLCFRMCNSAVMVTCDSVYNRNLCTPFDHLQSVTH